MSEITFGVGDAEHFSRQREKDIDGGYFLIAFFDLGFQFELDLAKFVLSPFQFADISRKNDNAFDLPVSYVRNLIGGNPDRFAVFAMHRFQNSAFWFAGSH